MRFIPMPEGRGPRADLRHNRDQGHWPCCPPRRQWPPTKPPCSSRCRLVGNTSERPGLAPSRRGRNRSGSPRPATPLPDHGQPGRSERSGRTDTRWLVTPLAGRMFVAGARDQLPLLPATMGGASCSQGALHAELPRLHSRIARRSASTVSNQVSSCRSRDATRAGSRAARSSFS